MSKILAIAPHPDDETLGCGGSILKHISRGDEVSWMILTSIFEVDGWSKEKVKSRQLEIEKIAKIYGFASVEKLEMSSTKLDTIPMSDLIEKISCIINKIKPNTIYLNFKNDVHTDHQIAFKAVISCTKNFRFPFIKRILLYETLSETEFAPSIEGNTFHPNVFIDITHFFEQKKEILKLYEGELMGSKLPRSLEVLESLAKYRGSRIGSQYAEAFMLIYEEL